MLERNGDTVELPTGNNLLGRALGCLLRFNDPAVSRQHVRIVVDADHALVEDLGSANGTLLNGVKLRRPRPLADGDLLELGRQRVALVIVDDALYEPDETTVRKRIRRDKAHTMLLDPEGAVPRPPTHCCPQCKSTVPWDDDVCPSCGYTWHGRAPSITQAIKRGDAERRYQPRVAVDIPVVYSSRSLTFDAVARDLSEGGLFVASELLDAMGTDCNITLLPDGFPAVHFEGTVCHVVSSEMGEAGRPPGLGVKFTNTTEQGRFWLVKTLASATSQLAD